MRPPIALPGKYQPVRARPDQLISGSHGTKHAPLTRVGFPDLPPRPIGHAGDAYAPGVSRPPSAASCTGPTRHACERDLLAVGRPRWVGIPIHARIQVAQRL